ncbi:hypothetical protein F5Y14DRAFT_97875 [Nemania sp. NC0429]|nr:hypothetical protein F5Y14DRAFT_97875 [Nemania sp. NC0429]
MSSSTSTSKPSAAPDARRSTQYVHLQLSELTDSYFPKDATASTLAGERSGSHSPTSAASPTSTTSPNPNYPLSPLDREYTKPSQDLDVAQQLSKQPTYWSVKGWLQRTADSSAQPAAEDPEMRARKFEQVKKDLLASAGHI